MPTYSMNTDQLMRRAILALTHPDARWQLSGNAIRDFRKHSEGACPLTWHEGLPADKAAGIHTNNMEAGMLLSDIMAAADVEMHTTNEVLFERHFKNSPRYHLRRLFLRLAGASEEKGK
jgi:hypothetical protein